ncbi:MAG TPA: DUF4861 family protein [Bacteroidota bacterium]|nr:DUF4861 family protein [Bacteroidota bacterium]
MKRISCLICALLLIQPCVRAQRSEALIRVTNESGLERRSETVEVPLAALGGPAGPGTVFAVSPAGGEGGGVITQETEGLLLFQADFLPHSVREFRVRRVDQPGAPARPLVDGRYVLPREDYAWENDRIAFRMYGPALAAEVNNGIDVWTKRVRSLVVAKWYAEAENSPPGHDPYHQDRGEGADFFDVGRSLGAGACALWSNGRVHQPGVFSSWKTLANGPLRVEFELTYAPVGTEKGPVTERMRVSLDAGHNLNRISVTFTSPAPGESLRVAWGLVRRSGVSLARGDCWMGLWGATNRDTVNGSLGTGVVLLPGTCGGTAEDSVQYLLTGCVRSGEPLVYEAGAGWTRSGDYSSQKEWDAYLAARAGALASPLRVSVGALR